MDFGIKLKELRNKKNLTQLQMAQILETSKSNISKYEAGRVEFRHISENQSFFRCFR